MKQLSYIVTRRAFLRGTAVTLLGLGLGFDRQAQAQLFGSPPLLVSPEELAERLAPALSGCPSSIRLLHDSFRIIDFREPEAYLAGHTVTAVNLSPAATSVERDGVAELLVPQEVIVEHLSQLGVTPSAETILYSDQGNLWAARLYWILDYYGHSNIRILDGGFARWSQEQALLEVQEPTIVPAEQVFTATPQPQKLVDADWILASLDDPEVVFVDARPIAAYDAGHLPGAVSVPWRENINWDDESFRSTGQLATRFATAGVSPSKTIICYCELGVLSAHNYFVLRLLGYPDVRLYDGSWADWTSVPGRPVEQGG